MEGGQTSDGHVLCHCPGQEVRGGVRNGHVGQLQVLLVLCRGE